MHAFTAAILALGLGAVLAAYADAETLHAIAEATRQTLICAAGIAFGALLGARHKVRRRKRRPAYARARRQVSSRAAG